MYVDRGFNICDRARRGIFDFAFGIGEMGFTISSSATISASVSNCEDDEEAVSIIPEDWVCAVAVDELNRQAAIEHDGKEGRMQEIEVFMSDDNNIDIIFVCI